MTDAASPRSSGFLTKNLTYGSPSSSIRALLLSLELSSMKRTRNSGYDSRRAFAIFTMLSSSL